MKKLFFAVILFTMAIVCLAVGASCKKKNAGTSALSDYEDSVETIESNETKTSESAKSSDTADTTESVKASEETSFSENISSEESTGKSKGGKTSETTETTETNDTTEIPESSDSSEESKPSESTESPKPSESTATSEESSESVSESKPESSSESNSESISESSSESVSDSVESSSSEETDSETIFESQSETTTETDTDNDPATDDSWGDSSESCEESSDSDKESGGSEEPSDSGDSSESGGTGEDIKTVFDIANGKAEELTVEAGEVDFTAEFFSILKGKGYTHFKFNAKSDGVGDYELSNNKYSPDNGVADIRVEAYRFFDKSVSLKSSEATYIRIYDFVFFSSEETENLTFGDNGYLCYEGEGLVYADYGSGEEYGFKFPDKYFEFERSIKNGNAVVTYKTSDGYRCGFEFSSFDEASGEFIGFNYGDGIVSDTSIYISQKKLSEKFVAIRPADRMPIIFNKCELVYSGKLKVGQCRPDKSEDGISVAYSGGEQGMFYLCLKKAKKVKIIIETKSRKDIWIYSDNETSCDVKETNGKYETMVTLSYTGVIKIVIDDCETFSLRYEIIS